MGEFKDLNELLSIARNINEGKYDIVDVSVDPESELYDIALYFNESLKKLQTVSTVMDGTELPAFEKVLGGVIADSKHASEDVLAFVDKINFNINDIKDNLDMVKQFVATGDFARASGVLARLEDNAISGQDICCDIVSSLEFKGVAKQKIDESIKVMNVLEERLAAILIKLGIKQNVIDVEVLDKMKDTKEILQDQDLVDRLLKEFGV